MKYPSKYVVWDLETTGLDPKTCEIVEVAALRIEDGEIVDSYTAILNHDIDIPEQASNIHGITREKAKAEGVDPVKGIERLLDLITGWEATVTHNGHRFDIPFLLETLKRLWGPESKDVYRIQDVITKNCIDTAVLRKAELLNERRMWNESFSDFSNRIMNIRAYGVKFNIKQCCEDMNIDQSAVTLHRAGGDVEMTNEIYKRICLKPIPPIN